MPRAGLTPALVVSAALAVLDERGPGALTLAAVAERTGVAAPSLYKHVTSLGALRDLVTIQIYDELAARLTAAALGRSADAALFALAEAYQAYAEHHPHRYALMPQAAPVPPTAASPGAGGTAGAAPHAGASPGAGGSAGAGASGADSVAAAGARVISVLRAVLAGFRLADDDLVHAMRGLRAALHGFALLSCANGFGLSVDVAESRRRLITTIVTGLRVIHRPAILSAPASTIPG